MKTLALGLVASLATAVLPGAMAQGDATTADQVDPLVMEARGKVKGFGMELKKALKAEIQAKGFESAVAVCNLEAPAIATQHSTDDWQVSRTSLKLRNSANQPDNWEIEVMKSFEARLAAGANPESLEASVVQEGQFRYMKAIAVGEVCLACHGTDIQPSLKAHIDSLYPEDKALGYQIGQLRGAFTLSKPVQSP